MSFFTVDIIGDLALGESFGCLENAELHPWVKTLNNFLRGMIYAATARWYPLFETKTTRSRFTDLLSHLLGRSTIECSTVEHRAWPGTSVYKQHKNPSMELLVFNSTVTVNYSFQVIQLPFTASCNTCLDTPLLREPTTQPSYYLV